MRGIARSLNAAIGIVAAFVGLSQLTTCSSDETARRERPTPVADPDFGRRCAADDQCAARACVPHIGDTVCSQLCDPDTPCPDDWTCWTQPASANSEERSICVSPYWSLCRPC